MSKGERERRLMGVLIEGFVLMCATFMHHVYFLALHCVTFKFVRLCLNNYIT
jgi:hypothetical protein